MTPERVRELLLLPFAVIVLVGWSASLADALLYKEFTPVTVTTPVMLVLAGFMVGSSIVKRAVRGDE